MMDLVIAILAVLTIPGIPVSIWFQRRSSRIRNRIVWDNVGLCKSTWLLIGAFVVSIVCAIASAVLAVYYHIIGLVTHIPQDRLTMLLLIECIIHFLLAGIAVYTCMQEKDKDNIVFWSW